MGTDMDLPPNQNNQSDSSASPNKTSRAKVIVIVLAVIFGVGVIGQVFDAVNPDTSAQSPESAAVDPSTSTESPESLVMPDFEGVIARDAEASLEELGFPSGEVNFQDASADDRWVIDLDNWFVCGTKPESGTSVTFEQVVVILVVKNSEVCPASSESASNNSESGAGTASASEFGPQSAAQLEMLELIEAYRLTYDEAQTDLQQANARLERDEAICEVLGSGQITDWSGVVDDVGATSEALGWVKIAIGENVTLETWNNEFSDIFDDTLVSRKSPLYETLLSLTKGQVINFSGKFIADSGVCLGTKNLTEYFAVNRPEFLFKFTSLVAD
jgi:hypothetical protein